MPPPSKSGFTLIELSIALVIIGLVVGGVLVGQEMIRTARLRKVVGEMEKLDTAIRTFKLKYNCLPGDCPHDSHGINTQTDGNVLGDGDGNGYIAEGTSTGEEPNLLWVHLHHSGLYPTRIYYVPAAWRR